MESLLNRATTSLAEIRKTNSSIQLLQVHKNSLIVNQEDDFLPDSISVCHASVVETLREGDRWINNNQIDAVLVGPDCSIADILSIRAVTSRNGVALILHTLKFEWKAKEFAIETNVDEYHIGFLDQLFTKRVKLIKKVKSFLKANPEKRQLKQPSNNTPSVKFWLLKRCFDIAISVLIILSLLPILLIILPILKLETKGSLLSSSQRVGKNYKIFDLYKFKHIPSGSNKRTVILKFLNKLHLTGLPQILNVLKGDMSFVGNYPVLTHEAEQLTKDGTAWRFLAPAGIVGLWRFNHTKNMLDCEEADMEYTMTNTPWLDIKIICHHFVNLLTGGQDMIKEKEWMLRHHHAIEKSMPRYA